jgi:hypothetical protein
MQGKYRTKHYYFNTYWASMTVASTYRLYIWPQWDLEKLYTQKERVQDTLEGKLSAIGCDSGNVEVQ